MIDRATIYENAQGVIKQSGIEAKIYNVKRQRDIESEAPNVKRQRDIGSEEVVIYFYAKKRIPLKELARDLEFTLNVPIKLERVTKEEFGRVGETQILAYHQCCAPLTKHCLFDDTHGCPYGIPIEKETKKDAESAAAATAINKAGTPTAKKTKKKRKKVVRRIVIQ